MDEELVQNVVMDEEFVKNSVMNAKIDSKVVMDLSISKLGGWNILQPCNRKLLEECIEENEPWLLSIRIPSRDSFFMIQYLERHYVCDNPNVIHLESHFEQRALEVRERSWMNPDMHTMLLDMNILKPMEMILMVLHEQPEDDDQMNTAGEPVISIPETLLEWEPALKERGGFWE